VFYGSGTLTGSSLGHILWNLDGTQASQLAANDHNLFWGPSAIGTWTTNYTYAGTDIHAAGSQPIFVNAAQGDFSLAPGSPGKAAASDGGDIGVRYNAFLKKGWLGSAFTLPTQLTTGLTAATSTAFSVNPTRFYQIWFFIPVSSPCAQALEQFTIEGVANTFLQRDINGLVNGTGDVTWVEPGGPARWITLGRHKAPDGTLSIAWQHPNCVEQVFIRELPTALEAYTWILQAGQARRHHAVGAR
jgi:hypothetical protein